MRPSLLLLGFLGSFLASPTQVSAVSATSAWVNPPDEGGVRVKLRPVLPAIIPIRFTDGAFIAKSPDGIFPNVLVLAPSALPAWLRSGQPDLSVYLSPWAARVLRFPRQVLFDPGDWAERWLGPRMSWEIWVLMFPENRPGRTFVQDWDRGL